MKKKSYTAVKTAFLSALLVAGCSASRPASLEQAQGNLQRAQQDPQIAANAQAPLYDATQSYTRAEKAWKDGADRQEVNHLAYLTNQKIEIARESAKQKMAEAEAQRLAAERERVILAARTREAEQAKRLAEARAGEAEAARQQAQANSQEAQMARQEAIAKAREAEHARIEAASAAEQNRKLAEQLSQLQARQTERGLELTLSSVLFDFDKATLKPGAERSLSPLVEFLQTNPTRRITIEGHTDSVGSDAYNRQLSQQRAGAIRDWFVQHGVSSDRLVAQGLGKEYPVASNDNVAGRQENRRVQIIISSPEQTAARR